MIRKTALVALLLLLFPMAGRAEPLTLEAAIDAAMESNPNLRARTALRESSEGAVTEATGAMTPRVTFSENFLYTNDPVGVFAAKLQQGKFTAGDFNIPTLNDPKSMSNWTTRIEVRQPVFQSGVDWATRRAAIHTRDAAGAMETFEALRTKLAVMKLYYAAVAFGTERAALSEGVKKLRSLEASYELMEAPTSASTTNALVARSVRTSLEAEEVKLSAMRDAMLNELAALMGRSPEERPELIDPLPTVTGPRETLTESAGTRPDVEASESKARAAEEARKAALRQWGPNVHVYGAYNLFTGDFTSSKGDYEVGARLSIPLYSMERSGQIQRAKADARAASEMALATKLSQSADLASAGSNLAAAIERLGLLGKAMTTAREAVDIAGTRYAEGTLPLMDYAHAIENWVRLRLTRIDGHAAAAQARAEYDFHRNAL